MLDHGHNFLLQYRFVCWYSRDVQLDLLQKACFSNSYYQVFQGDSVNDSVKEILSMFTQRLIPLNQ